MYSFLILQLLKQRGRKNYMKKIIALLLAACIASSIMTACTSSDGYLGTYKNPTDNSSDNPTNQTGTKTEDVVLMDNDYIKAMYVDAYEVDGIDGVFYVTIKVENKTDTDIVITLEDSDVDGETIPLITTGVPLVIRPGNSGQTGFIFSMVNLSISSLSEAEKATFRVIARNSESYSVVYESELVTINLH